ncbi:superoxide dismutase [Brevibacillus humidisoli]|uniref:superoxide dismutase n=1 Tax=Brevibacillus humidisoli TaxID=2895522 RepID=UPI001E642C64|nr:superoxide dismutase [Brevibacillus humidisoli]UFJ39097.1 superoxide dismutase [Brevibacillus humidisoli]
MRHEIQQLIDWSQWGMQWVEYLRRKFPSQDIERDLAGFTDAFMEIGKKASMLRKKGDPKTEITRLTTQAEEIQQRFHQLLRQIQNSQSEPSHQMLPVSNQVRQPVPINRPVPIGAHKLPPLPYDYDALEPHIDAETMRIHHDILHRNYVEGLNKAETMMAEARTTNNFDLIKHWEREAAFNGAGHYLHTIFWQVMHPNGGGTPQGELAEQIIRDFGSFDAFKRHFSKAAEKVEGGGWALFVWSPRAQRTTILQAEKHQNLSQWESIPLLVLDVWEHSYFLKYQSQRSKYIEAWWNVVNWPHVQDRYLQARRLRWQPY